MDAIEFLISKLNEEQKAISESLVEGNAKDFAHYQYLCGQSRGLLIAHSIIKDLASTLEQDDD